MQVQLVNACLRAAVNVVSLGEGGGGNGDVAHVHNPMSSIKCYWSLEAFAHALRPTLSHPDHAQRMVQLYSKIAPYSPWQLADVAC